MQASLVFSRYSIDRVFRPRKLDRAHPRELLECAFDIITPVTNSLLPDAEAIYAISEIIQEFPSLQVLHLVLFFLMPVLFTIVLYFPMSPLVFSVSTFHVAFLTYQSTCKSDSFHRI